MKKVLLSLLLFSCYGLQSANVADEKIVYLRLSNGSEFTINNSLAQALRTIHDQLEYLGDTAQEDPLQIPKDSVTAGVLTLFKDLNQESITTKEQVLERITTLSLLELVQLYNADSFLHFTKTFNEESFSAILFEKIFELVKNSENIAENVFNAINSNGTLEQFLIERLYKNQWQLKDTLQGHTAKITSVAFSPDGSMIATGSDDVTAKLWNTQTGKILRTLGHASWIKSVAFSPDGSMLLTGSQDGTAKLWNTQTGDLLRTLQGHTAKITSVAFSPNGSMAAAGSADGTVKLWNTLTGELLHTLQGHTGWISSVAFSPDGQLVATGSWDSTTKIWDAQTGQLLRTLQGHTGAVSSVIFSPNSQLIVTGSSDKTAKVWNAATGICLHTLQGHNNQVFSVAFSPDGKLIVTFSSDRTAKLWNLKTGELLCNVSIHSSAPTTARLSPNGSMIAVGAIDGTVNILVSNLTKKGVNLQKALELSLQDLLYLLNTDRTLEDLEEIRKIKESLKVELLASDSLQEVEQTQVAAPAETRPEEPPAKLQKQSHNPFGRHAHPGRSQVDSDEGEDEEFFCKFCNQEFNTQKELKKHEKKCDKKAPAHNEDDWL